MGADMQATMDGMDLIGGRWVALRGGGDGGNGGGAAGMRSHNPARPAETVWRGAPVLGHVDQAVSAARAALRAWADWGFDKRVAALRAAQALMRARADSLGGLIMRETGKAAWDSLAEAKLLADKIDITLEQGANTGMARVTGFELSLGGTGGATRAGVTRFRPHGVMAVVGPFNFPMHLPNGHIVPALAMGNTVVFKPSDKAPACGQALASLFQDALESVGAPKGVVNLVHGAAESAARLVSHEGIDGVLFTGSWPVGRRILEANLDRPGRMIALEMGGNNAAVLMPDCDLRQAVIECVRSGFVSAGQRCTCTRRIIVHRAIADRFLAAFEKAARALVTGDPRGMGGDAAKPVFMGPVIREESRRAALAFQADVLRGGGTGVVEMKALEFAGCEGGHFVSAGAALVPRFTLAEGGPARDAGCDAEVFAPFVRISVVESFEDALEQANASRFGLAASLFAKEPGLIERFLREAKAGCVNINTGTAGASSKLPFGGVDRSGNHRPAGAFSLDYCAYPVASMVESGPAATIPAGMAWENAWVG